MRVGIFGGTFDPVHDTHLTIAQEALSQLKLDRLFLVPARPWQKTARASDQDRLEMLRIALHGLPEQIGLDPQELNRAGNTYSIDTLWAYRRAYGSAASLYFIMGADQWRNLKTWILWEKFPQLVNLAVFSRDGLVLENPYEMPFEENVSISETPSGHLYRLAMRPSATSSSAIRLALKDPTSRNKPIAGLPVKVQQYILEKGLFSAM